MTAPAPRLSMAEYMEICRFHMAPAAPESFDATAAVRRVMALADDLDSYVAARGRPAPGTYDDGVNRAQAAAADIRAAVAGQL